MRHTDFKAIIPFMIVTSLLVGGCSNNAQSQTPTLTATAVETQALRPSPSATATSDPTPIPLPTGLPNETIPYGYGLATHVFAGVVSPQLNLLNSINIRFVHDDMFMLQVCPNLPQCNFLPWDNLVNNMARSGIRVILNLGGFMLGPATEDARMQFTEYAALSTKHYEGQGVIFELWGEPDGDWSWMPHSDPQQYILLANETIAAMREADPHVVILGPNVSTLSTEFNDNSWRFLKAVEEAGLFSKFDAVNVHLYNGGNPESQISNLLRLRRLIDSSSPTQKIPITSSEWGYNSGDTAEDQFFGLVSSPEQQAKFLVRSWLINSAHEINLSIWYDWKDDLWNPNVNEQHFGVITSSGQPKPAFYALQTLTTTLNSYQFVRRVAIGSKNDFLLLFRKGQSGVLAAWTIDSSHSITIPGTTSSIQSVDMIGNQETFNADNQGLSLTLTDSPRYILLPNGSIGNENVFWQPNGTFFRLNSASHGEIPIAIQNPSTQKATFELQAKLGGNIIGSTSFDLDPKETKTINLPLDINSTTSQSDFFVEVNINDQESQQSAWIWLQK